MGPRQVLCVFAHQGKSARIVSCRLVDYLRYSSSFTTTITIFRRGASEPRRIGRQSCTASYPPISQLWPITSLSTPRRPDHGSDGVISLSKATIVPRTLDPILIELVYHENTRPTHLDF